MFQHNSARIFQMHRDSAFRDYLAWYQSVKRIKLHQRWTDVDYVGVGSSGDEDTPYDTRTWDGSHVELAQLLIVWLLFTAFAMLFLYINISTVVGC
jgi:hypothetical protein